MKQKGFKDIDKDDSGYVVPLSDDDRVFLKVMLVEDGEFSHYFKHLDINVRYLFLVKDFQEFLFVKEDYSPAGRERDVKFKFAKENIKNSTLEKLNSLQHNDIHSFDNLFDAKAVVKEFYKQYREKLDKLSKAIKNIENAEDIERYAQILFDRLIFLHFIQTKKFLSEERNYLLWKLRSIDNEGKNYFSEFLKFLFFEVLNKRKQDRTSLKHSEFNEIPFLNGGLFREHRIEIANPKIWIGNEVLEEVLTFLSEWIWYVDETADFGEDRLLSPEILGHIFEKTITKQKEKGAYYTPSEVTNYIAENTILKFCLERINSRFSTHYSSIISVLDNKDHSTFLYFDVLKDLTVLDNACGSGAFLLSAQKLLFDLYSAAWETLKGSNDPRFLHESELISKSKTESYYFKRLIITGNIYGADIEEGAIEICKLRLWLSLVSEIDRENAEPLPNIDYNIIHGNSLIGYILPPEQEQMTLGDDRQVKNILAEIDGLKKEFVNEEDPRQAMELKANIDEKIDAYDSLLNKKLAAEYTQYGVRLSQKQVEEMHPLHWRLKFSTIFSERNGFDIIIGNPPYIESRSLDYPIEFLKTNECGNTYAYFFENSAKLAKDNGRIGFIVPISSVCTDRMNPLQQLLISNSTQLMISNFDDRPGKIFEGLEHCRSSIIIANIQHNSKKTRIYTTKYNRWYSEDRAKLFAKLKNFKSCYDECSDLIKPGIIPKIGTALEHDLLKRLRNEEPMKKHIDQKARQKIWYHNAPQYWIRAMDFVPKFQNKNTDISSHVKELGIKGDKSVTKVVIALLNSSLFYWFFITTSNCRDLTLREIQNFNIDLDGLSKRDSGKLVALAYKLMTDFKNNSILKETNYKKTGMVVYQEFYPKKSKHIIDQIDDVFADHYEFTQDQRHFIKTFDEQFRMGEEEDEE